MPSLTVAYTPRDAVPADVSIVIDCIRATSTLAQALASGYERAVCVGEIGDARVEAQRIGGGAILGGERDGVLIEGFDLGNSPAEYLEPRGHTLVLTTTNGTRAILQASLEAGLVLTASLLNLASAVEYALASTHGSISVRCAGVRGDVALDDAYVAGRIVRECQTRRPELTVEDSAALALGLVEAYPEPLLALQASQSARDLEGTGLEPDVARCAHVSTLDVAPVVVDVAPGRIVLESAAR
jgi:2-phosphosulfolactate phosphatase